MLKSRKKSLRYGNFFGLYLCIRYGTEFHWYFYGIISASNFKARHLQVIDFHASVSKVIQNSSLFTSKQESSIFRLFTNTFELANRLIAAAWLSVAHVQSGQLSLQCVYNFPVQLSVQINGIFQAQISFQIFQQIEQAIVTFGKCFVADVNIQKYFISKKNSLKQAQPKFTAVAEV